LKEGGEEGKDARSFLRASCEVCEAGAAA
jgi:hypothetical protein